MADTNLDTKYGEAGGSYDSQNAGGRHFEALMADSGLSDVFRTHRGRKREYTRYSATVLTRLDRAYSQKFDSPWRFVDIKHTASAMRGAFSGSDHAALVVEIETAKSRRASEHEERIDPKVYADPAVRRDVQQACGSMRCCKEGAHS